ncbi:MAG: rane protein [Myxococcaceae bacterium]|nr:rane protein [Myxococcaceae bacterium]
MAKTIVGLFDTAFEANALVREVVRLGIPRDHVSLMVSRVDESLSPDTAPEVTTGSDDAMVGAGIGAVAGGGVGLLLGLVAFPIPGLGPVIAAGPIAAALTGAGIGAVTGGVIGALTHVGVPEEHAQHYAEGVRRGGTLVTVGTTDASESLVTEAMNRHHAVDVSSRAAKWREGGWTGFDPGAGAYTPEEIRRERARYSDRSLDVDAARISLAPPDEITAVGTRPVERGSRPSSEPKIP